MCDDLNCFRMVLRGMKFKIFTEICFLLRRRFGKGLFFHGTILRMHEPDRRMKLFGRRVTEMKFYIS